MPTNRFAETFAAYSSVTITSVNGTSPVQSSPEQKPPHRWDAMICSSSAAVSHDARLEVYTGALSYYLGTLQIPSGAGFTNVPAVEALARLLASPNDGLVMGPSAYIRVTLAVTLGVGETINCSLVGGLL